MKENGAATVRERYSNRSLTVAALILSERGNTQLIIYIFAVAAVTEEEMAAQEQED